MSGCTINKASTRTCVRGTKGCVEHDAQSSLAPAHGSALVWSSDYPKEPGMYWVRYHGQKKEIVTLTGEAGNLKQLFYGGRVGLHLLPKLWSWQWAGPIPEPQEPNS